MAWFSLIRKFFDVLLVLGGTTRESIDFFQWTPTGRFLIDGDHFAFGTLNSNPLVKTHFLVHGWHENSTLEEYEQLARNYYILDPLSNIILVDYGELASVNYLEAPAIVRHAGQIIGTKILSLINIKLLHVKQIHIFAHSLGTHVSGMAARVIRQALGQRIARISASDPAGPLFRAPFGVGFLSETLTKDDADLLDITHTTYSVGTIVAFGTVDTYVDLIRGRQPGCVGKDGVDERFFCDHRLARAYFTESILSCGFLQTSSNYNQTRKKVLIYGEHMPVNRSGVFRLQVNNVQPYAQDTNTFPNCFSPGYVN